MLIHFFTHNNKFKERSQKVFVYLILNYHFTSPSHHHPTLHLSPDKFESHFVANNFSIYHLLHTTIKHAFTHTWVLQYHKILKHMVDSHRRRCVAIKIDVHESEFEFPLKWNYWNKRGRDGGRVLGELYLLWHYSELSKKFPFLCIFILLIQRELFNDRKLHNASFTSTIWIIQFFSPLNTHFARNKSWRSEGQTPLLELPPMPLSCKFIILAL
jgi:hypothetical protein